MEVSVSGAILSVERSRFLARITSEAQPILCEYEATINKGKPNQRKEIVSSNADIGQASSREIALRWARRLNAPHRAKGSGQTAGKRFEEAVGEFIRATVPRFQSVRPGLWRIENVGNKRSENHLARYQPYSHLDELARKIEEDRTLEPVLGNSYAVSPDILVLRRALTDQEINRDEFLVDDASAFWSPIRALNSDSGDGKSAEFVHAVVSCKWTMRSDRSQNTRSEALNLIRNRKGRAPHIVAVTAEPMMVRIASLALGTGDIDIVYHAALPELISVVQEVKHEESLRYVDVLVNGGRLRDISDMPVDFTV
jgi:hypothetical protein